MLRGCILIATLAVATSNTVLMDESGSLHRQIPDVSTSNGIVAVVYSPDTPSLLGGSADGFLCWDDSSNRLACRGATLSAASAAERTSLATTSLVAGAIVIDGITEGDVEMDLRMSRHGRTLTALIRARLALDSASRQTLILGVVGPVDEAIEIVLTDEVQSIFEATAAETNVKVNFEDMYEVVVLSVQTPTDASQMLSTASDAAKANAEDSTLSQVISSAQTRIRESGVIGVALDPPHVAQAFLTCRQAYSKQARTARARIAAWRGRVARGLVVDGFGADAESLRKRALDAYDAETLSSAGLPLQVASYRFEIRTQLQELIDDAIRELFEAQVTNLEKSTIKKFQAQLLRTSASSEESAFDDDAAAMRTWAYNFDSTMGDLEVPSLELTKDKASREMSVKLNQALVEFPDSSAAQLKRMKQVKKTVSKEKKPSQRAVEFGLDLVAMIRPDGFGSLQGFAGYNVAGNSVTVGVHNDADDPQVIAQFGGVRPPLLRVQPKLRIDAEF